MRNLYFPDSFSFDSARVEPTDGWDEKRPQNKHFINQIKIIKEMITFGDEHTHTHTQRAINLALRCRNMSLSQSEKD